MLNKITFNAILTDIVYVQFVLLTNKTSFGTFSYTFPQVVDIEKILGIKIVKELRSNDFYSTHFFVSPTV